MSSYRIIRAFISIAESLVTILTFGSVEPGWSLDFGVWRLRQQIEKNRREREKGRWEVILNCTHGDGK